MTSPIINIMFQEHKIKYTNALANDSEQIKELLKSVSGDDRNFNIDEFIAAKLDNTLIGCIRIKNYGKNGYELASLVVSPSYRNNGIGKKLVKKILELQKDKRPIYLLTSSERERFYNLNGFEIILPDNLPDELKNEYEYIMK